MELIKARSTPGLAAATTVSARGTLVFTVNSLKTLDSHSFRLRDAVGAIGALMNRVQQPRKLLVRGLNAGMGTAAGADELVEILTDVEH